MVLAPKLTAPANCRAVDAPCQVSHKSLRTSRSPQSSSVVFANTFSAGISAQKCQKFGRRSVFDVSSAAGPADADSQTSSDSQSGASESGKSGNRFQSSWDAVGKGGPTKEGADYLYELGQSDINLNIDTGQNSVNLDSLFTGNFLGHQSDIADGSLRHYEFRSFSNLVGDYYVAPRFMDEVALHMARNYLVAQNSFDKKVKVPLILGIWGPKGTGKTFQTELTLKKMGVESIIMSAGELEHEWAGTPGKLIRERYRKAAEMSRVRGKMTCLIINDIDAGVGRFQDTQVTVNNQIVMGTLMNLCDNPEKVSVGEAWRENDTLRRTPIIVTGNDFSTLYAPLVRDGRMQKFFWEPNDEELVDVLYQMYKDDGLEKEDMLNLRKSFPKQPLDFFGALRASTYDDQIRNWIVDEVVGSELTDDEANMSELSRRLIKKENLPQFEPKDLTLDMLIEEGQRLTREQQLVNDYKLSQEYFKNQQTSGPSLVGFGG